MGWWTARIQSETSNKCFYLLVAISCALTKWRARALEMAALSNVDASKHWRNSKSHFKYKMKADFRDCRIIEAFMMPHIWSNNFISFLLIAVHFLKAWDLVLQIPSFIMTALFVSTCEVNNSLFSELVPVC